MPVIFKVKVGTVGHSLKVTIPKEICEALELSVGDTLALEVIDHEFKAKKVKLPNGSAQ
jgi:antitoxin component of MazEF toxin-antitoxin module